MKIIETERWVPSKEDPSRSEYIGQRTGQEVFEELRQQLENMGCLPDEYFLLDQQWEKGREIPKGADIFCTTDYGASEGIYLDVYLKWYEDGNPVTKGFITGKTLGESGDDLDNMERNLISTCQVCDCTRCARQNNCPNEEAACGECTPTNPAWHCADYLPMVERSQKC